MSAAAPSPTRACARIQRIRDRYQRGSARISVERARYYTESWRETEDKGLSQAARVAQAMGNVYAHMTHYVDPDDRIAGHWTEHFLGVPVDIERGVFNGVLEAELSRITMVAQRARTAGGSLWYMLRKGRLRDVIRARDIPLDLGLRTMSDRRINPFAIDPTERRELTRELLPYWRGRTLADHLQRELARAGLHSDDMRELAMALPGNTSRQVMMLSTCATVATIQGHLVLDYETVLRRGLDGMKEDLDLAQRRPGLTAEQRDALDSFGVALRGVRLFASRLAQRIAAEIDRRGDRDGALGQLLATCTEVPLRPATTLRQAVQAAWTVKTAVELAHPVNLHCFGRLDQLLHPYYAADLKAGRTTPGEATELLEELLLKIMAQNLRPESNVLSGFYHRFFGSSPVTLGGVDAQGRDASNPLTELLLRAAHNSKAITNVSLRVAPDTPDALLLTVAELLAEGTSSFSLFNDPVNMEAMQRTGFALEDARDYAVMGCVETTCPGRTGSMSANALLLSRVLDVTLRNGDSRTLAGTLRREGLQTGQLASFADFETLVQAFLAQARHFIARLVAGSNLRDRVFAERLPAPHISVFTRGCVRKAADVTRGGGEYDLSGISMINSIANLTDSLHAIKKLVFEQRRVDLPTLLAAVDANFVGYEALHAQIRSLPGKWGNGATETDALARRLMGELSAMTTAHRSFKGGPFVTYAISMTTHTIDGRLSIASPDGRKAATPYAASANPANVEKAGITGVLRSVAALPGEELMGCAVNARFHPSAIGRNPSARANWVALIRTYFELGGSQLQPTVASAETLRAAQERPQEHRDLIIKVGGYSTYFVDLGDEIQNEIIARTVHA